MKNQINYYQKSKDELIELIEKHIKNEGTQCDLNHIDVSENY